MWSYMHLTFFPLSLAMLGQYLVYMDLANNEICRISNALLRVVFACQIILVLMKYSSYIGIHIIDIQVVEIGYVHSSKAKWYELISSCLRSFKCSVWLNMQATHYLSRYIVSRASFDSVTLIFKRAVFECILSGRSHIMITFLMIIQSSTPVISWVR